MALFDFTADCGMAWFRSRLHDDRGHDRETNAARDGVG